MYPCKLLPCASLVLSLQANMRGCAVAVLALAARPYAACDLPGSPAWPAFCAALPDLLRCPEPEAVSAAAALAAGALREACHAPPCNHGRYRLTPCWALLHQHMIVRILSACVAHGLVRRVPSDDIPSLVKHVLARMVLNWQP